jgi:hypothetical protein
MMAAAPPKRDRPYGTRRITVAQSNPLADALAQLIANDPSILAQALNSPGIPALAAFATQREGLVSAPPTTNGTAPKSSKTTSKAAPAPTFKDQAIVGTISRVAGSFTGAQLDGVTTRWFNGTKGTDGKSLPVFDGFKVGERVLLELDSDAANARVVSVERVNTASTAQKQTSGQKAAQRVVETILAGPGGSVQASGQDDDQEPTAAEIKAARGPAFVPSNLNGSARLCAICGGPVHGKNAGQVVAFECATRQFEAATGTKFDIRLTGTLLELAAWLTTNRVVVAAHTNTGRALISNGKPERDPDPTQPTAPKGPAPKFEKSPIKKGRQANVMAYARFIDSGQRLLAPTHTPAKTAQNVLATEDGLKTWGSGQPRPGTYTGFVVKHAKSTVGLVNIVSLDMPGAKSHGDWLSAADQDVASQIVKAQPQDHVEFMLRGKGDSERIVTFRILSTITKDSGVTPGVKNSGKQQPAEPKRQSTDPKVKQARIAKRKTASTTVESAPESEEYLDKVEAVLGDDPEIKAAVEHSRKKLAAKGGRKSAPKATVANCSGSTIHRATCKGNC